MRTVEIYLPYFKKGDDLNHALTYTKGDNKKALKAHAENLIAAAEILMELSEIVDQSCEIQADTHYIGITAVDEIIDKIIDADLGVEYDYEEEE